MRQKRRKEPNPIKSIQRKKVKTNWTDNNNNNNNNNN